MWDLIVSVPDHCLSFYFSSKMRRKRDWYREPGTSYVNISHESKTVGYSEHVL